MLDPAKIPELLARIASSDESASREFHLSYAERLRRIAWRRGVADQDLEDVVQDVMVAAIRGIQDGTFQERSQLGTWLTGILKNKIADYWRKAEERGSRTVALSGTIESGPYYMPRTIEARVDLDNALEQLPDDHRVILLLNASEGLTTAEIAVLLRRNANTVGRILANAKQRLRAALGTPLVRPAQLPAGEVKNLRDKGD